MDFAEIATHLDILGLHHEADVIDLFLKRGAIDPLITEKRFLSELANVLVKIKDYDFGEQIQGDLTIPGSRASLEGKTKSYVTNLVAEALRQFYKEYIVPTYGAAQGVSRYSDFVTLIEETYIDLKSAGGRWEGTPISFHDVKKSIKMLETELGRWLRIADEKKTRIYFRKIQAIVSTILDRLAQATEHRNGEQIQETLERLFSLFPTEAEDVPSVLVEMATESYAVSKTPHKVSLEEIVHKELISVLGEADVSSQYGEVSPSQILSLYSEDNLYDGWKILSKKYERAVKLFEEFQQRQVAIEDLSGYFVFVRDVLLEAHFESEEVFESLTSREREVRRERMRDVLQELEGKYQIPEVHNYQNIKKMQSTIISDLESLVVWINRYFSFNELPSGLNEESFLWSSRLEQGKLNREGSIKRVHIKGQMEEGLFRQETTEERETSYKETEEAKPEVEPKKPGLRIKQKSKPSKKPKEEKTEEELDELKGKLGTDTKWEDRVNIPLAQFLFHTEQESKALTNLQKTFKVFETNLELLRGRASSDIDVVAKSVELMGRHISEVEKSVELAEKRGAWRLWHNRYIMSLFTVIQAFYKEESDSDSEQDEQESQAYYMDALEKFMEMLRFEL